MSWLEEHGADPERALVAHTLRALAFVADPSRGQLATPEALAALGSTDDETALDRAVLSCARGAILDEDRASVARYAALSTSGLVHAWLALADADAENADAIATLRQGTNDAAERVEVTCVRALAAEQAGAIEDARGLARRATRMARTEDLPQSQYLASLVLARVRRVGGAPHLALRILDSLARVAPPAWRGRLAWELALAGRTPSVPGDDAEAWRALFTAAQRGDVGGYDREATRLRERVRRWPAREADLDAALAMLDVRVAPERVPSALRAFVEGATPLIPGAISGIVGGAEAVPSRVLVYVSPNGHARRVAALAEPLTRALVDVAHEPLRPGRTHEAISIVALAGPDGIARDALFARVYGFSFQIASHGNLMRVLLHRMRQWLAGIGDVTLDDGRVALTLERPLLIPDLRCEQSLEERILRALSRAAHQGIKETAAQLGVPLRTAQEALQALREDGAVATRRDGRHVSYRVEDTTFSEPTRWNAG
ncbi:MAG: hypothetical protein AB7S26_20510 [Sandaracinaceae bacterium]